MAPLLRANPCGNSFEPHNYAPKLQFIGYIFLSLTVKLIQSLLTLKPQQIQLTTEPRDISMNLDCNSRVLFIFVVNDNIHTPYHNMVQYCFVLSGVVQWPSMIGSKNYHMRTSGAPSYRHIIMLAKRFRSSDQRGRPAIAIGAAIAKGRYS